jgi:predicted RNA-binding Zn-ribbon protein involved in translation (DUF1610 family)
MSDKTGPQFTVSDIRFNCPHCGQTLVVDVAAVGMTVACPTCGQTILTPQLARLAQPLPATEAPSRARRWPLAVLSVAALSLLLGSGALVWQWHQHSVAAAPGAQISATGNEPAAPPEAPSAELTVATNFEGASARVLSLDPVTQTIRITPNGNPERGWPCWWFLRVTGVDIARPLVLRVLANTPNISSEGGNKHVRLGTDWSLPDRVSVSTNGVVWAQSAIGERQGNQISYSIQPEASNLWLAWGPPFTLTNAWKFVQDAGRSHSYAKYFTLARSREDRLVPALQVSEGRLPAAHRPVIWVIARQHAWEVGGTWVSIGFAEWLLSQDPRATRLRSQAEIFIVPVMDSDRVATGDGGKESIPRDHNEDWSDAPNYPEVAAVEKRILAATAENRMALLVDLHDPNLKARASQLWATPTNFLGALAAQNQQRFIQSASQEIAEPMAVAKNIIWDGPEKAGWWQTAWHHLTCPWVYEHANPQTVAVTLEVPWNAPASTISGYRSVGEGLGRAIELYLRETPGLATSAK